MYFVHTVKWILCIQHNLFTFTCTSEHTQWAVMGSVLHTVLHNSSHEESNQQTIRSKARFSNHRATATPKNAWSQGVKSDLWDHRPQCTQCTGITRNNPMTKFRWQMENPTPNLLVLNYFVLDLTILHKDSRIKCAINLWHVAEQNLIYHMM